MEAKGCDAHMAIINRLDNTASVVYNGTTVTSNTASTLLLLAPTVSKTVDKLSANVGDTLTYTVTVTNVSLSSITNLPFTDALPQGSAYVGGSFAVNGTSATPTVTDNTLTYTIPSIPAAGAAVLTFQVRVTGGTV
jgi:uncharacterized repeat protein (TIGR01451 family)